jgi:hypothetical protein
MIRERTRGLIATLPFEHILRRMKIEAYLLHSVLVEHLSSEEGFFIGILTKRIGDLLATHHTKY